MSRLYFFYFLLMYFFLGSPVKDFGQACLVKIQKNDTKWQLTVDGKPYYIKGAGGDKHLDVLIQAGGNTIRTWGTENAKQILDDAHRKGLKVMLGLWVQHERHGFDYNDEFAVKKQLENFRKEVQKYKNHPALLVWGIGNEYELNYTNTKVWAAVNAIAKMIHEEDPNHPTSTVTAGTNPEKLKFVMDELTEIDIYGINTYADIVNVKNVLESGGFKGPYMITEWGPTGHWEIAKTMWGSSIEQNSTEKAASYLQRYQSFIASQEEQCIGSFAFLWGQKQEYTSTWYGLFSEDGKPTEALDALTKCWSGKYPENRSPSIKSVFFNGKENSLNAILKPGQSCSVRVEVLDLNQDKLSYVWELYPESTDLKTGGDAEDKPALIYGRIKGRKTNAITLKAPLEEGRYRLFLFVHDGEKMAYLNIPFYVESNGQDLEIKRVQFKKQHFEKSEY